MNFREAFWNPFGFIAIQQTRSKSQDYVQLRVTKIKISGWFTSKYSKHPKV